MTKRLLICLGVALLILALAGVWSSRPEPPVLYQGKDVWTWTLQLDSLAAADREAAITALRALGPAAVPPLVRKLRVRPAVGQQARAWLGPKIPGSLGRKLTPDPAEIRHLTIRGTAAVGLKVVGTNASAAVPALLHAVRSGEPQVVWKAADALGAIGSPAVPELLPLLNDANPQTRRAAIYALGETGPAALPAVPALVQQLGDRDATYRGAVAFTLTRIGSAAGPAVLKLFAESTGEARRLALHAVELLEPRPSVSLPVLLPLAQSPEAESRRAALEALAVLRVSQTNALTIYRAALDDSEPRVRATAAAALGMVAWRARDHLTLLTELGQRDRDEGVRAAAQLAAERIQAALSNAAPR